MTVVYVEVCNGRRVKGMAVVHSAAVHWEVVHSVVDHSAVVHSVVAHFQCSRIPGSKFAEAFALNSYLENSWIYHRKCHRFLADFGWTVHFVRRIGIVHTEDKSYNHFRIADS